ncbi:MAG: RsmB/NOP family class I SAM-dependent RNA methyltransferase [Desulfovibrio sp.]|nr:RsmB/NOP family class I SAM-dependent RNA methyltransferase [Desulfovibrio sp.]
MRLRRSFRLVCEPEYAVLVEALLRAEGYVFAPEEFSPFCRRLEYGPRPLGASLAAFFGYIYIQDRSSMLPPLALAPAAGECVLDMCASPGGKSGFLAQLTGPVGFVLANEPAKARLATLRANLHAVNLTHAATSAYPGQDVPLSPGSCRAILLDAPCSGWGTARKNPEVLKLWRGEKIGRLTALQRLLLTKAAELLKEGGRLVYSTCTTNERENEEQLRFAEEVLGLERDPLEPFPGFVFEERAGGSGALRIDGDKSESQGFFLVRLRKPVSHAANHAERDARGWNTPEPFRKLPKCNSPGQTVTLETLEGDCCDPGLLPPGLAVQYGEQVYFSPSRASAFLSPGFIWQGMPLGRLTGGRFRLAPRLRSLLPCPANKGKSLVLEGIKDVQDLLRGQSRMTGLAGREAGLWWRDLPLCLVRLSQGRVSAAF